MNFKKNFLLSVLTICIVLIPTIAFAEKPVQLSTPKSAEQCFELLTDGQSNLDYVQETSCVIGENLIVGFSRIPLEIGSDQPYFFVLSLTWTGEGDTHIQLDVDLLSRDQVDSVEEASVYPVGGSNSIPLENIDQKLSSRQNLVVIPHVHSLRDGKYWLRIALNKKVFAFYEIFVGQRN